MKLENDSFEIESCVEFERLLPLLSPDAFELLQKSIQLGGVREAILVWEDKPGHVFVIDGHNRCRIAEHEGISHTLEYRAVSSIKDKDGAIDWIINNQLMRRNLTDAQRIIFVGMAAERKASRKQGRNDKGGKATFQRNSSVGQIPPPNNLQENKVHHSRKQVAAELGSTPDKVRAAASIHKQIKELEMKQPKTAAKIREDVRTGTIQTGRQLKKAVTQATQPPAAPAEKKAAKVKKINVDLIIGDYQQQFKTMVSLRKFHIDDLDALKMLDTLLAAHILSFWHERGINFMAFRNLEETSTRRNK